METVSWPPFFGEHLENGGPLTEISRLALERVGLGLELRFLPWKRAALNAKKGKSHALFGCYHNQEREQFFRFSEQLVSVNIHLIGKKQRPVVYRSLADLMPYSIGIIRGFEISKEFDAADSLKKVEVERVPQLIKMLENDRIDLAAEARINFVAEYRKLYPGKPLEFRFIEPPLSRNGIYVCFSRAVARNAELVAKFDRGLRSLRESGDFRRIMRAHGLRE